MARLIVKSPYIKGSRKAGGYLRYIGTREGVERLPSGYMGYMAGRQNAHGLFGDEDQVDMDAVMKELDEYPGNIWTHIISLKRADAERLGYDHAKAWRSLLRAHRNEIAEAMHVPPNDFRWYAAFHDEGDHPHVHMMAWSTKPGQAYLSKDGIRQIKSSLTNDIFKQDLLHTYEQKSAVRDELVRIAREKMLVLAKEMRQCIGNHPEIENLVITLSSQLQMVKGKKKYGYLPKAVKETVDKIVDQMERLPVVNDCYQTWWEFQCQVEDFYSEKERQRPPLSAQKEFRSIKNVVVQVAVNLHAVTFEDTALEMEDHEQIDVTQLIADAESGNPDAQYTLGKLYLSGPEVIPDGVEARCWLEEAAYQGHIPAAYSLGKLLLSSDPEVRDTTLGIQWLEYAAQHLDDSAAYLLGKAYLKGEIVKKDVPQAIAYFTQSAKAGNPYAQYMLGKLCLAEQEQSQAYDWFVRSASQGNQYAQFFLNRWGNLQQPSIMLSTTQLLYHMGCIFQEQAPPIPGGIQIDRKRLAQMRKKKIAMGHKPDDHAFTMS